MAPRRQHEAITIESSDEQSGDDAVSLQDVELDNTDGGARSEAKDDDEDVDMEEVDVSAPRNEYASVHVPVSDAPAGPSDDADRPSAPSGAATSPVYHDGKGQPRANISLTFDEESNTTPSKQRNARPLSAITPRDRAARLEGHKLHVLAILAHTKMRNRWINDEEVRSLLYNMSPQPLRQKLRYIHPKKEPLQRERVRMFESFMVELVRWWAVRFYLDPDKTAAGALRQPDASLLTGAFPRRGRRVDGWVVESAAEREARHSRESQAAHQEGNQESGTKDRKGKRKANTSQVSKPQKASEITVFHPGSDPAARPLYLRLLPAPEPMTSAKDLLAAAKARSGSRETSAQLFCGLCRSLGIPARLVVSPQVASWSVGAGKVGQTVGATDSEQRNGSAGQRKGRQRKQGASKQTPSQRMARRGSEEATSDDFDFSEGFSTALNESTKKANRTPTSRAASSAQQSRQASVESSKQPAKAANGSSSRPVSLASGSVSAAEEVSEPTGGASRGRTVGRKKASAPKQTGKTNATPEKAANEKAKKANNAKGEAKNDDYRDEKWRNLSAPLDIEFKPKLRATKIAAPKESALEAQEFDDVEPVDLSSPPTMWVEVFSKPYQKWITVDPVRARIAPTGNRQMEPAGSDRSNKLVYVMAFEEDGYARDVTARYTKTLYSRISKMRPPGGNRKGTASGDWWESIATMLHRPQRLGRDAAEDAELEEAASKEPMPNSVGGFKDHPVFALERHLKRDEALHPYTQIGTFQGIPVFHRKHVVLLRSARQWFNQGRKVKDGEEALKWVKTRGYTINSRRAEEQARAEGAEEPQEGLYGQFQTELYVPPPVQDGRIPKNHFGNIDLFVPTMLPEGAAHIPHNGAAKVARKLGIDYAEAIVGFEFRKHRSMPRLLGIVVPEDQEEAVVDAYWESEHAAAEKELSRQQERALRHWRKMFNALKIARRVQEQYGQQGAQQEGEEGAQHHQQDAPVAGGGFIPNGERSDEEAQHKQSPGADAASNPVEPSEMTAKLQKYGSLRARTSGTKRVADSSDDASDNDSAAYDDDSRVEAAEQDKSQHSIALQGTEYDDRSHEDVPLDMAGPRGAIVSLADLARQGNGRRGSRSDNTVPSVTTEEPVASKTGNARRPRLVLKQGSKGGPPQSTASDARAKRQTTRQPAPKRRRKQDSVEAAGDDTVQTTKPGGAAPLRRSARGAAAQARAKVVLESSSGEE